MTLPPVRIVALDDHPIVVAGIRSALERWALERSGPEMDWMGEATNGPDLLRLLADRPPLPQVALIDLQLPDGTDPAELISSLTRHGVACVILTSEVRPVPIRVAVAAGAVGLVLKSDPPEQIAIAVADAAAGRSSQSGELAQLLVTDDRCYAALSPREVQVLQLLAEGHTRRSVAAALDPPVSESTVSTYLERIFDQYTGLHRPVHSAIEAVRQARLDGHLDRTGHPGADPPRAR